MKKITPLILMSLVIIIGVALVFGPGVFATSDVTTDVNVLCIQGKVQERDLRIQDAFDSYYDLTSSALAERTEQIVAAWSITDRTARRAALREAYRVYKASVKQTRADFRAARTRAWETFRYERVLCGPRATDESGAVSNDGSI